MIFIGEVFSSFLLLLIGLGGNMWWPHLGRGLGALVWFVAIFSASVVGGVVGSGDANPIFPIYQWLAYQIDGTTFLLKLMGQVVGMVLAVCVVLVVFDRDLRLPMGKYAIVLPDSYVKWHCVAREMVVSCILMLGVFGIARFTHSVLMNAFLCAAYIAVLIYRLGPITGASFNPLRDLIPRVIYHISRKNHYWRLSDDCVSANLGPMLGAILAWLVVTVCSWWGN